MIACKLCLLPGESGIGFAKQSLSQGGDTDGCPS